MKKQLLVTPVLVDDEEGTYCLRNGVGVLCIPILREYFEPLHKKIRVRVYLSKVRHGLPVKLYTIKYGRPRQLHYYEYTIEVRGLPLSFGSLLLDGADDILTACKPLQKLFEKSDTVKVWVTVEEA